MAVLTGDDRRRARPAPAALLPGADRVLAAHPAVLPQPDQLCGPFATRSALHALLDRSDVPDLGALALAAGTHVWPHDEPAWRPAGAPLRTDAWEDLPRVDDPDRSGTDAAPLAAGLPGVAPVAVVPVPAVLPGPAVPAAWGRLLVALREADHPVAVVANLRTGPTWPPEHPLAGWDVGHFVVLVSFDGEEVGVADSYVEAGADGWPPGCRGVPLADLVAALAAPPGRGLLLLAHPAHEQGVRRLVAEAGLVAAGAAW
ncbi:DUF6885 family protein [Nocardioides sp. AX2bis]|uniref:DUF6885 family protein n=1 Tax=Nocardioides sp. AX2bis TaxID=2653157 RepID=UPI0012EF0FB9|nr:hypothetical protein [Nocardioides sp. AX2bis]VXA92694.1 conserved hypothetical protein [Nocardioides sp. AX2bis]